MAHVGCRYNHLPSILFYKTIMAVEHCATAIILGSNSNYLLAGILFAGSPTTIFLSMRNVTLLSTSMRSDAS